MTQDQLLGLDESHLILVGRGPHRLTAATAAAFNDMQVAAAYEGFNLQAGVGAQERHRAPAGEVSRPRRP